MYASPKFKHIAILVPAVAKSFHTNGRTKKIKHESTTTAIIHCGGISLLKFHANG